MMARVRYVIIDHGHKKEQFYINFQRPGVQRAYCTGVSMYPILTFLDKWHHKIVNSIYQDFKQQQARKAGVLMGF